MKKIKILDADTMEQLLEKSTLIDSGATSDVYRVPNIYTKRGFLCLKMLNRTIFKSSNDTKTSTQINWNDDDDHNYDNNQEEPTFDFEKARKLYSEYELLKCLDRPNIEKVYGFFYGSKEMKPAILLEYCKFNLEKVIKNFKYYELVGVIYEICSAMKYVHQNKVIHRDIKMRNILIYIKKHVKLCDFGIAKVMDLTTYTELTKNIGTFVFMAQEIFDESTQYNEKVDVYSFGVVMYYIVTKGEMPLFRKDKSYESLKFPKTINSLKIIWI
ncbi:Serine/threonine-protein kinase 36 [Tritrichomonas musculus]|uniref:Serine/threonine-protein kinase 36 n=1 Tax=Tritrichomonas musculus TaxID=1915356 RepID=A0ABR2IMD5_9EUKA